jgi:hypothetical protein
MRPSQCPSLPQILGSQPDLTHVAMDLFFGHVWNFQNGPLPQASMKVKGNVVPVLNLLFAMKMYREVEV